MTAVHEFDLFYISYDEPKKEEFYADLLDKAHWAKRVDGVTGFDAAHKKCASESNTDYFITVDGDNIVDVNFFDEQVEIEKLPRNSVVSWAGKNIVNGLVYGNGGIKLWPKETVLNMKTHEQADTMKAQIDFCWDLNYFQMNNCYSTVYVNGSAYQAFRAGFREGVKMSLDQGNKVPADGFEYNLHNKNYQRLLIWCTAGLDVPNGEWAIYGARYGCYLTNCVEDWDFTSIRDYNWFNNFWNTEIINMNPQTELKKYGQILKTRLGMQICDLNEEQSKFFKRVYTNPPRTEIMYRER